MGHGRKSGTTINGGPEICPSFHVQRSPRHVSLGACANSRNMRQEIVWNEWSQGTSRIVA